MSALDIVIFGGSGDLSLRKLMPALYFLYGQKKLPEDSRILALSRAGVSQDDFRAEVLEKLRIFLGSAYVEAEAGAFVKLIGYMSLDISDSSGWDGLADYLAPVEDREIIYYMAVPPNLFGTVCEQLNRAKLNPADSRLVVEKPLGEDEQSAEQVNKILSAGFRESQIYRIDHYLGKQAIQNLLALRFSNRLISAVWNNDHIESVQITVAESVGVEGRAEYLDHAGILRDMVQNHLIQILTCLAMETPLSLSADDIRDEKVRVVKAIRPITTDNVMDYVVRAQYISGHGLSGYLEELNITSGENKGKKNSDIEGTGETFVALKVMVDNDRWHNVPFYLRTGKRLKNRFAQIAIQFKPIPRNIFNAPQNNRIIINLQPDTAITLDLFMKKMFSDDQDLEHSRHGSDLSLGDDVRIPDAYEKLLGDVIAGNQAYFVRHDEIIASWKWIDGIRRAWEETGLEMHSYPAGSMGPSASDDLLAASGHKWYEG